MSISRRDVLKHGAWLSTALLACGGNGSGGADGRTSGDGATHDGVPGEWTIDPAPYFIAGGTGTFDLSSSLPPGTPGGGTFSVDPSGAPLPAGMTLSPTGLLSVGTASAGVTTGVAFAYETP